MSNNQIDLDRYISQYTGFTKVKRLVFIADNSEQYKQEAVRLAIRELRNGINTNLYKEVAEKYGKEIGHSYDAAWANDVDQEAQKSLEKLEIQLNAAKTNLMKEATRTSSNEIGDFYFSRGDLQNALKSYLRARDYCTSSKHVINMCLNVIRVSIEMGNYALVQQYVSKAEQTPDVSNNEDLVAISKLNIASALANLDARKYKVVAKKLLSCDISIDGEFTDVVSANDITLYSGVTALATFDRRELKEKVLDSASFKNFLELNPAVRQLLTDFYDSKYTSCLGALDTLLPQLTLDIYLRDHVQSLYEKIRSKALIQYVSPFSSVDLKKMATVFSTTVENVEKEIAQLIMDKSIKARIDSHNKILYARVTDERNNTYQRVMEFGDSFVRETEANILRMNILKHRDFVVKPTARKGKTLHLI